MTGTSHVWILEHFALFRLALFFCCFAYWVVGYHWFKPAKRELRAAIMAVWVQMSLGTLLDIQIVRCGVWVYRPMAFTIAGVPLDLHMNWALIWGFFLVWLYSRLRPYRQGPRLVVIYVSVWTLLTLAFDAVVARQLLFLKSHSALWWLADVAFLFGVQGATLWVYHAILFPPLNPFWAAWSCRARSTLYVGSLAYVFYAYAPRVVLLLTESPEAQPLFHLNDWRVLLVSLALPLALGTWATWEFTGIGFGTPLPLDPPRRLVTTGPYAHVRNPMQISGMMLAALLALYYPTKFMLLYVLDMMLVSALLFHLFERDELTRAFGDEYKRYRREVRNWLPRRRPYVAAEF